MATEKQIQANRNNAQKSTGPRTGEGKARASQNSLKHGLLARDAVLPGEDPAEFEAQLAALEADIEPGDSLEHELVRQLADAQWRMRRLTRLETGYLAASLDNARAIAELGHPERLRPGYESETLLLGFSMFHGTQSLVHLARYDAHLGRRFERALQQITHLRDAREKRRNAAETNARQTRATPLYPAGPSPRPSNGPSPAAVDLSRFTNAGFPQYGETNPISPNHIGIKQIRNIPSPGTPGQLRNESSAELHLPQGTAQRPASPQPARHRRGNLVSAN